MELQTETTKHDMNTNPQSKSSDSELDSELEQRFAMLPQIVRDAIKSADVQKSLRTLADTHKLHVDQWQKLENEVMLALLGFEPVEDLQTNIRTHVGVGDVTAAALAEDISKTIFEPIRQEMERELEHPEAQAENVSGVEAARTQELQAEGNRQKAIGNDALQQSSPVTPATPPPAPVPTPVVPATPPPAPPVVKAVRAPTSSAYQPGEPSAARKNVHDDPYRESPA